MTAHDSSIPIKRRENKAKKPKSDKDTAFTKEKELNYGIDRLNLSEPAVKLGNDSE